MSALGEPLKAEVELVAEKNEIGSLAARLATADAFERAGLTYSNLLAGVKVSIEKRAGGEPYVLLTSSQPVTEPFVDLLIELTWSSGRISREFTALLDPPSLIADREKQKASAAEVRAAPTAPQPKPEPVPAPTPEAAKPEAEPAKAEEPAAQAPAEAEAKTEPVPTAPVETIGGSQPTLLGEGSALPSDVKSASAADAYGPVKSGDTLGKIASATKPADVTLEQMLVLLTRNNPDAFSGKNMNRLKTGKILQLPSADEFAGITEADARKEVKIQARDWRAYRDQLAASAGQATPADQAAQQAVSGKVGATAEDKAASTKEQPKEVLKLSKNEPAAGTATGGDAKSAARVHALEEEVVAREKAVKESGDRVAKLEKQITDLQALLKMQSKGMADLQKPAVTPPAAAPQAPAQKPVPQAAAPVTPAPPTPPAPEVKPATPAPAAPAPPAPKSEVAPAPSQPAPVQPKPAPVKTAPVPAPEPSLMDQVLDQPAYLGGAIGVLIIIGALAVRAVKRRRESKSDAEESGPARAFAEASGTGTAAAFSPDSTVVNSAAAATSTASDEVDPVAEAEIFLAYGRDAQAEELLKEALENSPRRYEIHLKLLQIYANRKDAKSFEKVARDLQQGTGGSGEIWDQAVALGYQVDPENTRYAAGKSAAGAAAVAGAAAASAAEDVDFNIGSEDSQATTTDIDLGEGGNQFDRTQIIDPAAEPAHDSTVSLASGSVPVMDFNVDLPAAGGSGPEISHTSSASGLDFDIDLNSLTAAPAAPAAFQAEPASGGGLDFDMSGLSLDAPSEPRLGNTSSAQEFDLSGISLDLGTETAPAISTTGKDDHWYDVQTKFDLAKAYQEMGDKDGAREILKEVLQEGDAEQKTAAKSVLSSLDS
jgi:pilus assembly protein FimV